MRSATRSHYAAVVQRSIERIVRQLDEALELDALARDVAVAAGLCYATVDTDAIGSGRLPAAVCGVTCHKPTFGLLSSVGILAGEPVDPAILTLGHPCVMARSAHDVALALEAIVAAATTGTTRLRASARPVQGWRVGVARNFVADDAIRRGFMAVVDVVAGMQVTAVEIDVPFASASFDLTRVEQDRATIDTSLFGDLLVNDVCSPSWNATLTRANSRAVSRSDSRSCSATVLATMFQTW